jgi:hypothetical protein
MQIAITSIALGAAAITRAARANPNITAQSLEDELERGDIDGWTAIVARHNLTFSEWSGAMERAIEILNAR